MFGLVVGAAMKSAGSIYAGVSSYQAAEARASDLSYQAVLSQVEALRSARIIREEGTKFAAQQSLQYIGSGVQLMGSALITIQQTKSYAEKEATVVEERGKAQRYLYERQAKATKAEGKAAMIGGIMSAVGSWM